MVSAADFPPTGRPEWEARLVTELKQADARAKLTRTTPEGIALPPLLTRTDSVPVGVPIAPRGFQIQQVLTADASPAWEARWQLAQTGGAEALHITVANGFQNWALLAQIAQQVPLTLAAAPGMDVPANLHPHVLAHRVLTSLGEPESPANGILPMGRVADWGGSAVAELALLHWALHVDPALTTVEISLSRNFLTDVAKLRAARVLASGCEFRATLSPWHLTTTEPETNLLRATTAAMAGIIGGAQVIAIPPYGRQTRAEDADRWARGILLLLRHESSIDAVADPAAGSYSIEWLTAQLLDAAQDLWHEMQASGEPGQHLRQQILADAAARAAALQAGVEVLLGVNRYPPKGKHPRQTEAHQPRFHPGSLSTWRAAAEAAQSAPTE